MERMETTRVQPEALVGCEGFGVYGPTARIGSVERSAPTAGMGGRDFC
jgi:hypothetical protein